MPGTMTQLNVRMPRALKDAGDAALASVGVSPSEAIRALWERASDRGEGLSQAMRLLFSPATSSAPEPDLPGPGIVDGALAQLRLSFPTDTRPSPTDNELLEASMEERLQERGLI